jgi:hypothetical protein
MPKNKTLLLVIPITLLVLYNVFVFSLFGPGAPKFWPAYMFTTLALVMGTGVIGFCVSNKNMTLRDTFLNWPMVYVSCGYALIQVILSFVVLSADNIGLTAANLTQAVPLALYAILAASAILGRNIADEIDRKQAEQTFFIKVLTDDIERLAARAKDPELKKALEKLYDAARYSDPVSHAALSALENSISTKVSELSAAVSSGEGVFALCEEITLLLGDRESKCKFLK